MGRVVLECNNICKKFKNKVILDDVSFKLCEGDIVGLIGKMVWVKQHLLR